MGRKDLSEDTQALNHVRRETHEGRDTYAYQGKKALKQNSTKPCPDNKTLLNTKGKKAMRLKRYYESDKPTHDGGNADVCMHHAVKFH